MLQDLVGSENETPVTNFICAVTAGAVSSAIANPTDVLKVRMQSGSGSQKSAVTGQPQSSAGKTSFVNVVVREGVRGLWRGVGPTAARAALVAGVQVRVTLYME